MGRCSDQEYQIIKWRKHLENERPAAEPRSTSTHTTINTTGSSRGSASMFILGGVVVAIIVIGYLLFSNGSFGQSAGAGAPAGGGDVSISVETGTGDSGATPAPAVDPEPAPETAAEPAPAD
jgi:hypothetical protein